MEPGAWLAATCGFVAGGLIGGVIGACLRTVQRPPEIQREAAPVPPPTGVAPAQDSAAEPYPYGSTPGYIIAGIRDYKQRQQKA